MSSPDTFGLSDAAIENATTDVARQAIAATKIASWVAGIAPPIPQLPTFSNLDQTWTTLEIVIGVRSLAAALTDNLELQLNGDAGANYHTVRETLGGATLGSTDIAATQMLLATVPAANATPNEFGDLKLLVPHYAAQPPLAGPFKSVHGTGGRITTEGTVATYLLQLVKSTWRSRVPITELDFFFSSGNGAAAGSFIDVYAKP